ncbi:membrane protein [Mycobacterium heckeshornense]|uniref:Membrane protein n=2 Tax=Mycobacterium heckeshornense TaxID=110505 RepID=A0A7R7YU72_9MYCO|nr:membrane protein [Mycobacterium heckeshornense]BCQ10348.1 membrane protein [Mycobacterium heckeshornense]
MLHVLNNKVPATSEPVIRGSIGFRRWGEVALVTGVMKRIWVPLIVVVIVAVAAFCVYRLRGIFGVPDSVPDISVIADDIKPFNPKHVTYEVFGPAGTIAKINYLDVTGQPQRVDGAALPWSLFATTTQPAVTVNVVAQGDTDEIGCRITVNGVVKDERSATGVNAQTFCLVKAA